MSTASAVCHAGAVPVIADIDKTLTVSPSAVEGAVSAATRAIIAVHMRGGPARLDALLKIAKKYGLVVIEDVAQALGGSFQGRRLGTIGDVGCFSMQSYKLLNTGEGGCVLTDNPDVYDKVSAVHGAPSGAPSLMLNYKMNEFAGAIGSVQLRRLEGMLSRMRETKAALAQTLLTFERRGLLELRDVTDIDGDIGVGLTMFLPTSKRTADVSAALNLAGIRHFRYHTPGQPDLHLYRDWTPIIERRPLSRNGGPWRFGSREVEYSPGMCPQALDLLSRAIEITVSPQLKQDERDEICRSMTEILEC
jgi:8-amino-3,8-dideoxy-alpha-D-manno-octulosonate transaminase